MSARRAAVEAAGAAYAEWHGDDTWCIESIEAAIAAYLAHRAEAGFVEVRDVPRASLMDDDDLLARGWNACWLAERTARPVGEG